MNQGKYDKNSPIQVFEVKPIRKEFNFKITAADVLNDFLYLGDEKGTSPPTQEMSTSTPSGSATKTSSPKTHKNSPKISLNIKYKSCSATHLYLLLLCFLTRNCGSLILH